MPRLFRYKFGFKLQSPPKIEFETRCYSLQYKKLNQLGLIKLSDCVVL